MLTHKLYDQTENQQRRDDGSLRKVDKLRTSGSTHKEVANDRWVCAVPALKGIGIKEFSQSEKLAEEFSRSEKLESKEFSRSEKLAEEFSRSEKLAEEFSQSEKLPGRVFAKRTPESGSEDEMNLRIQIGW